MPPRRKRTGEIPANTTVPRVDGWINTLTALGTSSDKRTASYHSADAVSDAEALDLWRGNDMAARAIEVYPAEMLRAGYDVTIQPTDEEQADLAREQAEAVESALDVLGTDAAFQRALEYERAYGGAGVFVVTNDSQASLARPLDESRIADVRGLVVFEPRELQARTFYGDITSPKFGKPETFTLQPITAAGLVAQTFTIHESRLIIFPGLQVSRAQVSQRPGWGDSILARVIEVIRDFGVGFSSASALLPDFAQAVYSIQGLHDAVAADEAGLIKTRLALMDLSRSILRGIVLDAGGDGHPAETFQRQSTSVAGIPELLDRLIQRLSAALEIPVTRLMGVAPAGLNATGAGDTRNFYDNVARQQDKHLRPRLLRLIKLLMLSKSGPTGGVVPPKYGVTFCPLWQPSQTEIVTARKVQADIDAVYISAGVCSPEDVARSRFGGDDYSFETKVDFEALDAMEDVAEGEAPEIEAETEAPEPEDAEDEDEPETAA